MESREWNPKEGWKAESEREAKAKERKKRKKRKRRKKDKGGKGAEKKKEREESAGKSFGCRRREPIIVPGQAE